MKQYCKANEYKAFFDGVFEKSANYASYIGSVKTRSKKKSLKKCKEEDFYKEIKNTFNTDISKELFNNDYLIKILDEHKNREKDNYRKIWAVYSFLKWYDEYFVKR